ncbi:MAG: hypothetical protein HUU10_04155 [Bacteroidetes bacterium]|nr:hypothetical protein [Bacteroidota bacterium]
MSQADIRSIALRIEQTNRFRAFTDAEMNEARERFTEASLKLQDIKERKKASDEVFKAEAEPYQEVVSELFPQLKQKGIQEEVTVGLVPDYVNNRMDYLHIETAEVVWSRPLTLAEQNAQGMIFQFKPAIEG